MAQITLKGLGLPSGFGQINSIYTFFTWTFNLLMWLGWATVIIGIAYAFVKLIFALYKGETSEDFQTFRGELTRAIIIAIIGLLMVSAGFFLNVVTTSVGLQGILKFEFPEELKQPI